MHAVAAKAVALKEAAQPSYQAYARQVVANAQALADGLWPRRGCGRSPAAPTPTSRCSTCGARGDRHATPRRAATRRGITLNKNAIPYDPQPPMIASGIRVGTPAVTTQGMTEGDMKEVAALIGARGARRRRQRGPGRSARAVGALVASAPGLSAARLSEPRLRARVPPHPGRRRRGDLSA